MLGGRIDQSMDVGARVRVRVRVRRRPPFKIPPFLSQVFPLRIVYTYMPSYTVYAVVYSSTRICRAASGYMSNTVADFVFTQYTVEYDMVPVKNMKGGNLTENRRESRPHPKGYGRKCPGGGSVA